MRWELSKEPMLGDEKIKHKFLFFPITIEDEVRWLEFSTIRYKYSYVPFHLIQYRWMPVEFMD